MTDLSSYDSIIAQAAQQYPDVPADLIRAQLDVESGGNSQAKNKSTGATGIAQLMPATAASMGVDPTDPKQAIPAMFKIMDQNIKANKGDLNSALMEYYGGPNKKIWGPNTQAYPAKVMAKYQPAAPSGSASALAGLSDKISAARQAGYNDGEIWQYLQQQPGIADKLKAATAEGYNENEVGQYLGLRLTAAPSGGGSQGTWAETAANALSLGMGPQSGLGLTQMAATEMGQPQLAEAAPAAKALMERDLAAYAVRNPGTAAVTNVVGSLPGTVVGLGAANAAEAALLRGAPGVARFVAGEAPGLARVPSWILANAKTGAEAAGLTSNLSDEPIGEQLKTGAELGGALGGLGSVARAVSPLNVSVNPNVAKTALEASNLGVNARLPQIATNFPKWLRGGHDEGQLQDFTRAVSHTIGADAPAITQDVLADARKTNGQEFERLAGRLSIDPADMQLHRDLENVATEAASRWPTDDPTYKRVAHVVKQVQTDLAAGAVTGAPVSGKRYMALTQKGGPVDSLIRGQETGPVGMQLRTALDDALERNADPGDMAALQDVRQKWKNIKTIEPLVEKAQPHGIIDPTQLQNAVRNTYGTYSWKDPGNIGTLAEIGRNLPRVTAQGAGTEPAKLPAIAKWGLASELAFLPFELATAPKETAITLGAAGATYAAKAAVQKSLNSLAYRNAVINLTLNPRAAAQVPNYLRYATVPATVAANQ